MLIEDSSISANAIVTSGGNIQIGTSGLFVSPNSRITASSQFGIDGAIEITNPDVDSTATAVVFQLCCQIVVVAYFAHFEK